MLAEGDKILELIPQRPPMVMINTLESCDSETTICTLLIEPSNIFVENGIFTEPGIMELMAQTAAVRTGWMAALKASGAKQKPPVGVIGSISRFQLYSRPPAGVRIISEVRVMNEIFNASMIRCKVYIEDEILAESEMKIFITGD